jgi:phasin family protein
MNNPAEQFLAANKANMEAFGAAFLKTFSGAEKLVELNMAASKAALSESFSHAKAAMAAKTPEEFLSLQSGFLQPLAEKSTAYFQHVQAIATEGSSGFTQQIEAGLADAQKAFGASVDQLVKSAPAGTETAVAAFQNALSNSQKAVESAQATIKKATEAAQSNFAVATRQTTDMVKKASKATKVS